MAQVLMMGLMSLKEETLEGSSSLFLPYEDMVRKQLSLSQ